MDVLMPDGTTITGVPDGTTQAELQRRYSTKPDNNLSGNYPPALEAAMVGAGKTVSRIGQGIRQLLPGDNTALDQQVSEENRLYAPLSKARPWSTGIGEALPAMAIPMGAAGSVAGTLGRAAAANAIPGALEYGTPEERAKMAGIGAAGGAAGGAIGYGLGRLINPVRGANPLANAETGAIADAAGINLTPAQATGSKVLSSLDGTLATFPGSAGAMAKIQQGQREGFNRAAMGLLGEPSSASIGNDAAQLARTNIGNRIQGAASGVNVRMDEQLLTDLGNVESKYMRNLTADQKPFFQNALNDILAAGEQIPGETYQAWRSRIGARAAGTSDSEFKGALKGVQRSLDSAFDRSAGQGAAAAMTEARGQYRNFKTLEPLIEKAAMSSSNIPPAQVMNRALASGNTTGPMQNLAQLGQAIGNEYPNSGTAPRMLWQEMFRNPLNALNPVNSVAAPTAWMTAKLIHSAAGRAYLTNGVMTPEVERLLMRGGGLLGYAGASAAGQ